MECNYKEEIIQNTNEPYVRNYQKFINEIIPDVIGNGDFSNYSHEGIIDFNGKIGNTVEYHGIRGVNNRNLGFVKNVNTTTRVTLSQTISPRTEKTLCYFEYKSSQWNYVKQTVLEKDEVKHMVLIKTPKVLTHNTKTKIKNCGGYFCSGVEGVVRIEYGKSEDPDKFLENLFQTIEKSKNGELKTTHPKLTRLNLLTKLAHLVNKNNSCDMRK